MNSASSFLNSSKLAGILLFGALITSDLLSGIGVFGYVFVALALFAVRPYSLESSLFRSELSFPEWATAAWFGPKGFAAVVYGLLILESGSPNSEAIFGLIAIVVFVSIIVHSSTDVSQLVFSTGLTLDPQLA